MRRCCRIGLLLMAMSACCAAGEHPKRASAYVVDPYTRTGHPHRVAWYALPTNNPRYGGNYVGGGAAFHGEPRYLNEGTWGRDYIGLPIRRVWLNYNHGRHAQGGSGAYRTDGPHLLKK